MSVIEEKKALRTYIRQTERTLDPAYKAESSEAICRCVLALEEYRVRVRSSSLDAFRASSPNIS